MKFIYSFFLVVLSLTAQVGTEGSLVGVVSDPAGAVVPGAIVMAVNTATGLERSVSSQNEGTFTIITLPAGTYSIHVSAKGFGNLTINGINLPVGQVVRVPIRLEIGQTVQTTTVEAHAELLQTDKASLDTVIEERAVKELPLNGRDPIGLASLAPGVIYNGRSTKLDLETSITPAGLRVDQTEFRLDGMNSNTVLNSYGSGFPNVDSIAEFNIQTSNFGAQNGRNPVLVSLITKSGTNQFRGSLWDFFRNNALDARNTFASTIPKLNYNQFGGTVGGPILPDKTFFFFSYEGLRIRQQAVQTFAVPGNDAFNGIFAMAITDPLTRQPFPNNRIPASRLNTSSLFFLPYLLHSNSADGLYHNVLPNPENGNQFVGRLDHLISRSQRVYGRIIAETFSTQPPQYSPSITQLNEITQYNLGLSYNYTITPRMVLTIGASTLRSDNMRSSPQIGKTNYTEQAGIAGFPSAGREEAIGLPNYISFDPYRGLSTPTVPFRLWSENYNGNGTLNFIFGKHTLTAGFEYYAETLFSHSGDSYVRGGFSFNGQYTGDAFADYLLGYIQSSARNYPDKTFGTQHSPFNAAFIQDNWKISRTVTLDYGVRWEHWGNKAFVRGVGSTFDPAIGKAVAAENKYGQVDLTAQIVSPGLAAASASQWVPASQVKYPRGLYEPNDVIEPRLGVAWRPFESNSLVVRAAYGLFASNFAGNVAASAILGPPYFTYELQTWGPGQLQNWQTAWPNDPKYFLAPSIYAAAVNDKAMRTREWNISIQKSLPFKSAVTLSYVGNNSPNLIVSNPLNFARPGNHADVQAAVPYPAFGDIELYQNVASSHFNGGVVRWDKRFTDGLLSSFNYTFSKNLAQNAGGGLYNSPVPYAPPGYNSGRSELDHAHILSASFIWNVPFGRNHRYGASLPSAWNSLLGGWELTGIFALVSGSPLTFDVPGATLGNGMDTRPNLVGNPGLANPRPNLWFNPGAFSAPQPYTFGNSGIGILDGPAQHSLNLGLMKNLNITEKTSLQIRWEAFNALNNVNYGNPNTSIGESTTGLILSAGDARQMQLALKFQF